MYIELHTSGALHKKPCCIGLGLCIMLEGKFREFGFYEVGAPACNTASSWSSTKPYIS
jgi:hypothetical protein